MKKNDYTGQTVFDRKVKEVEAPAVEPVAVAAEEAKPAKKAPSKKG